MKTYSDETWIRGIFFGSVGFIVLLIIIIAPFGHGSIPPPPPAGAIGLPKYPGQTILQQTESATLVMVRFTTPDSLATVLTWYDTELSKRGWIQIGNDPENTERIQHYYQDFTCHPFSLVVTLNPERHEVIQTLTRRAQLHGSRGCP
jgi:hypothetical protein